MDTNVDNLGIKDLFSDEQADRWIAQGLYNLCVSQDNIQDIKKTLDQLERLYKLHFDKNENIAKWILKGFINLFSKTVEFDSAKEILHQAYTWLKNEFPKNEEMAGFFADIVQNLYYQDNNSPNSKILVNTYEILQQEILEHNNQIRKNLMDIYNNIASDEQTDSEYLKQTVNKAKILSDSVTDEDIKEVYSKCLNRTIYYLEDVEEKDFYLNQLFDLCNPENPTNKDIAYQFTGSLINYTYVVKDIAKTNNALNIFEKIYLPFFSEDKNIIENYAYMLVNHSINTAKNKDYTSLYKLEKLYTEDQPDNLEVAIQYTKSLANICVLCNEDFELCKSCIEKIDKLYNQKHVRNSQIGRLYAIALGNIFFYQRDHKLLGILYGKFEKLSKTDFPYNQEMAEEYAKAVRNYAYHSTDQRIKETRNEKLKELSINRFPYNKKIMNHYMASLVNLSYTNKSFDKTIDIIRKLKTLYYDNKYTEVEIFVQLCKSIRNLINNSKDIKELPQIKSNINNIESIYNDIFSDNEEATEELSYLYLEVTRVLNDLELIEKSIFKLGEIYKNNSSETYAETYSNTLTNLTHKSSDINKNEYCIYILENLHHNDYPKNESIITNLASTLYNLTDNCNDIAKIEASIYKLKDLINKIPSQSNFIKLMTAIALGNYILKSDNTNNTNMYLDQIIPYIKDNYPAREDIAREFVKVFSEIIIKNINNNNMGFFIDYIKNICKDHFPDIKFEV